MENRGCSIAGGGLGLFGFGSALAMVLSHSVSASLWWTILHGFLSWFYVIYYAIVH